MHGAFLNFRTTFYKYMAFYGGVVGANMTDANFRSDFLTWFWLLANVSYNASSIYTIIAYRATDTSWQSACVQGLCVEGFIKYLTLMIFPKRTNDKIQFLSKIYQANGIDSPHYGILFKWSQRSLWFVKYGIIPVASATGTFMIYPIIMYFIFGETKALMVPMVLPGIDETTLNGYLVLLVYHMASLFLCLFGQCNTDFMLVLLVMHMWPISEIFANTFNELNVALERPGIRDTREVATHFRNICIMHKEMSEYLDDLSEIYYYMVFGEVFTCAQAMCALVYCMLTMNWIPIYFLMLLMLTKLFAYCFLGTLAEIATDHVYETLLSSKWYLLPIRYQHHMRLMIARAQNPTILMAGTMPLNLDTFVRVMKTVYSVAMVLLNGSQ